MVAANHGIELTSVEVVAEGDWDPRGTLGMGREFPVGLTAIRCTTTSDWRARSTRTGAARLLRSAERYCVVRHTIGGNVDVTSEFRLRDPGAHRPAGLRLDPRSRRVVHRLERDRHRVAPCPRCRAPSVPLVDAFVG